jgi:hypothetical protein
MSKAFVLPIPSRRAASGTETNNATSGDMLAQSAPKVGIGEASWVAVADLMLNQRADVPRQDPVLETLSENLA